MNKLEIRVETLCEQSAKDASQVFNIYDKLSEVRRLSVKHDYAELIPATTSEELSKKQDESSDYYTDLTNETDQL